MAEYAASGKLETESLVMVPNCHVHRFQQKNQKNELMPSNPGAGIHTLQGLRSYLTQAELRLPGKHTSEENSLKKSFVVSHVSSSMSHL